MISKTLFVLLLLIVSGCAATGPKFQSLENSPADKALVYFYRPDKNIGRAQPHEIVIDGEKRAVLKNAGYLKLELPPGSHQIISQPSIVIAALTPANKTANISLVTEPAKRYFIRLSINSYLGPGTGGASATYYLVGNTLASIPEELALGEISELNYSQQ